MSVGRRDRPGTTIPSRLRGRGGRGGKRDKSPGARQGWNVARVRGSGCCGLEPHAVSRRAPKRESGRRAVVQLMQVFKTPEPADAMHRKHLQEIPDQSSNVTTSFTGGWDSSKTSELLSGMGVSALEKEEVDSENIPQELLSNLGHPQSPPRKRLKSKGNNKDFVNIRRPKLSANLGPHGPFRVQHLDLSNSVINVSTLHGILSQCSKLQNLSLEGLQLSDPIVNNLAQNSNLVLPNLCGCSGFSESALKTLLSSCSRLDELNLSWCYEFTEKHVQVAVAHVSETITQLNLSGYLKNLQKSDVSTLVRRCPNLVHLDLSDSVMLKHDCFPEFLQLSYLQHLSLSRCYNS
ncbi:S-phase kinase-associated protein 2 [Sciurus carolinensis]|uniref:S-phase kinase-associated protein 2 n=1 Tax=Sciurus carolinensis TaxID=30640 RepID=A0AA41NES9_SCICA|nr:S-phase kinase-associated protein 2 [Sciurus carolinensis]